MASQQELLEVLRGINDPEIGRSIVDLGMVKGVEIDGAEVTIHIALTIAGCPMKEFFTREVPGRVQAAHPEIAVVHVELSAMTDAERSQLVTGVQGQLPAIGQAGSRTRIIAVGSGKGGVGKSTVAVNLAVTLAQLGHDVGLLDADIWGFSVPRMLGAVGRPTVVGELLMPLEAHGVKALSIGNFVADDNPIVWRGPMLHKALQQFLGDVHWSDREYLVIDMPPGTGDVAISLSQMVPSASFVVVTTPQEAAGSVALRAAVMATQAGLRLDGVVENMSSLLCDGCGREHDVFGEGGGAALAKQLNVPLLGTIPLDPRFRAAADEGVPGVARYPDSPVADRFRDIARALAAARPPVRRSLPLVMR